MSENTQNITEEEVQVVDPSDVDAAEQTTENTTNKEESKSVSVTEKTENEAEDYQGDESDSDDESDEELNVQFPNLTLKDGTERYVVTADGVPQFYAQTIEEARKRMWDIARIRKFNEHEYNSYIREFNDENHIQVVGFYRFHAISYDRVLCYLSVRRVQEVQEVPDVDSKAHETKSTGIFSSLFG